MKTFYKAHDINQSKTKVIDVIVYFEVPYVRIEKSLFETYVCVQLAYNNFVHRRIVYGSHISKE